MKKLLHLLLPVLLLSGTPALAGDNVVMVELFTSQGCSSCPPADRNLKALSTREDVLALSMHVDYWDYLGWRDTFGSADNTRRQYAYREAMGARVVYTPQVIVHGASDVPGYRPDLIEEAIARHMAGTAKASISIGGDQGMLKARLSAEEVDEDCTIWMASYTQQATVDIRRGENAGETITYHNVVDNLMRVGAWPGTPTADVSLPDPDNGEGVAIWLQDDKTGRILAASFIEG